MHAAMIRAWGGQSGVRDRNVLESAVGMPKQTFGGQYLHSIPFGMAAAYAFHISEGQPFLDGNKRTGLMAALTFLRMHKFTYESDPDMFEQAMLGVANKSLTKEDLERIFEENTAVVCHPIGPWIDAPDDPDEP